MKIDLILMAAGNSRRFGSNKLLYEWRGKKLYRYMLDALLEAAEGLPGVRVRVVTQYEEILKMVEELAKRKAPGFLTGVYSLESVKGLSYTIRKALDFEAADPPEAFAFFTADTPEFFLFGYSGVSGGFLSFRPSGGLCPLRRNLRKSCRFFLEICTAFSGPHRGPGWKEGAESAA